MKKKDEEYLGFINISPIDQDSDTVKALKNLDNLRMYLIKKIDEDINKLNYFPELKIDTEKMKKEFREIYISEEENEQRIKITINDVLPNVYLKVRTEAGGHFANYWRQCICIKLKEKQYIPFKQIFIWVKMFVPVRINDVDNKIIKPILDGIVDSYLIDGDSANKVKYGAEVIYCKENPKTEIYIYGDKNIPQFIKTGIE